MKKIIVALLAVLALTFVGTQLFGKVKTEKVTYVVNLHCHNCVNKLTDNLSFEKGVKDFKISLETKIVEITYDPAKVQPDKFEAIMTKLGYSYEKVDPKAPATPATGV
ncbi:MAG: heavy-metal-associated domain-containing protein [Bacteroidales bacterium]|nr:heavy-metal-associated domain-containing protein [Bacteroidales bacterium]